VGCKGTGSDPQWSLERERFPVRSHPM